MLPSEKKQHRRLRRQNAHRGHKHVLVLISTHAIRQEDGSSLSAIPLPVGIYIKHKEEVKVNNFEMANWLPMEPSLGPPLPRLLNIFWPWYKGFRLSITNPPPGSTHWSAHFYSKEEGRFIQPPSALALDASWNCPSNPFGATDLRILVLDMVHAITLHETPNLGPIHSGKSYIYDCSTKILSEI